MLGNTEESGCCVWTCRSTVLRMLPWRQRYLDSLLSFILICTWRVVLNHEYLDPTQTKAKTSTEYLAAKLMYRIYVVVTQKLGIGPKSHFSPATSTLRVRVLTTFWLNNYLRTYLGCLHLVVNPQSFSHSGIRGSYQPGPWSGLPKKLCNMPEIGAKVRADV